VAILTSITFKFNTLGNVVMSWLLTTAYAIFSFFLIEPVVEVKPVQYVEKPIVQETIRVVEKQVPIQIPIENRVIEVVEKPVIQRVEIPVEVEKPVYIREERIKLNIPKYNFVGSTETKTFHKRNCKFSKLIKKKYKVHNNNKSFFKKKHFHGCKACIKKS